MIIKYFTFAFLFLISTSSYSQTQKGLDIDGEAINDWSGYSVSINSVGNTLAIGARGNDDGGNAAGQVRVYQWDGSFWIQKGTDIDGEAEGDTSGSSVSISSDGNSVAIGAPQNAGSGDQAGHVRVYYWDDTAWIQKGSDIDGEGVEEESGNAVSISSDGNTVAIGARYNGGTGYRAGHVRVYTWNDPYWVQKGTDIDGENSEDEFGFSVSISSDGNAIAIGAPYNDGAGSNAGHVRIYDWVGGSWNQKGSDIDGEATLDNSGYSVSMNTDGNIIAIGAPKNDGAGSNAGHLRIFQWDGTTWIQKGADIDGETALELSGLSASLSSDGNWVTIGAPSHDIGQFGQVRLYNWDGDSWLQKGINIDGEGWGDKSGTSVSLSSDGQTIAIGAPYNFGAWSNSGHVRVYEFCTETINTDVTLIDIDTLQAENSGVGITYQWIDCKDSSEIDGATLQTFGAATNGNYAVIINENGCVDTSECIAITDIGLGISKNPIQQIKIYPNPSSGLVYVQAENADIASIKLYNSVGQLVKWYNPSSSNLELNLKDFERGIYTVVIETAEGLVRKQIVLQ